MFTHVLYKVSWGIIDLESPFLSNVAASTVPAGDPALSGTKPSAGKVMTWLRFCMNEQHFQA